MPAALLRAGRLRGARGRGGGALPGVRCVPFCFVWAVVRVGAYGWCVVPGGAAAGGLSRRAVSSGGESEIVWGNSTSPPKVHGGCSSGIASPFVFVPLALVLFAAVAAIGAYRRRRCAEARTSLESEILLGREDAEDLGGVMGEKGWSVVA